LSDFGESSTHEYDKIKGYKDMLRENNIDFSKVYVAEGRRYNDGYAMATEIVKDLGNITAVFCANDELAIGLINHLFDEGYKVPDDISVVGYGDYKESQHVRPTLTTISEPFYDVGAVTVRTLIKKIEGDKNIDTKIELPYSFMERNSVKTLK
jgi:LacI family transcriptional regulator